ncbi:MAG: trypsin-like peptidase domain-containing protein [Verrucomicrobia bacterium]|nr:trypsin-like peptidase domain-containing protein [Verrucomicrobiota bacterium]MBV8641436.1 trypsin-like peptidase domain-containing protein [Verrucomicrobiota bacterium]
MSAIHRVSTLALGGLLLTQPLTQTLFAQASASNPGKDIAHQLNDAYTAVYEKVAPAVVVVDVEKNGRSGNSSSPMDGFDFFFRGPKDESEQPDQSEGSGFIVRQDGYIITNNHVIDGEDKINVKLKDGRTFTAKVIGSDERTDVAVIKIDAIGLPAIDFANSDEVKVGQIVCAIGTPYKFAYTFTTGVVSAKGRNELLPDKYEDYIQTDAAINPGNSGGPLCDIDGRVIGMNTLIHGLNRGLGFAISSNLAKQVSEQLITSGKIVRPWLGIIIESLNDQNRTEVFKGVDKGVVVRTIQADTPAAKSDLRPADVITDVDGVQVTSARELQNEILKKKVGAQVNLGVWRNGKKITVTVKTEELPGDTSKLASAQPPTSQGEDFASTFGVQVQDVTPALKQELGLKSDSGVVVTEVVPNSPAAVADIQTGDVITEVGRNQVTNTESFQKALAEQKGKPNLLLLLDRKGVKTYSIVKVGK